MAAPILFILGPSGAGKTTLADYLASQHRVLHINFDQPGNGVDIEGLRKEWNALLDDRNPISLVDAIRNRIRAGDWRGASVTCPSGIVPSGNPGASGCLLSKEYLQEMKSLGLHCIVVYGTRDECLAAFLARDPDKDERYWRANNPHWHTNSAKKDFGELILRAFSEGRRRSLPDIFKEIQHRFKELQNEPYTAS
jgi:hypothetical protein